MIRIRVSSTINFIGHFWKHKWGYFWKILYLANLRIPGILLSRIFLLPNFKSKIKKYDGLLNSNNSFQETKFKKNMSFDHNMPRLLLGFPSKVLRSAALVESNLYFSYRNTYSNLSEHSQVIDLEDWIKEENFLILCESNQKNILILDGNYPLEKLSPNLIKLIDILKELNKLQVIVDCPDLLVHRNGTTQFDYWYYKADLLIVRNPLLPVFNKSSDQYSGNKFVLWPTHPLSELNYEFVPPKLKTNRILFSGFAYAGRNDWLKFAKNRSLPVDDFTHKLTNQKNIIVNYMDYIKRLATNLICFTNGYRGHKESILVDRVVECMLLGTVILYQSGSYINRFFVPYEHYVPVYSLGDLLIKSNYLLNNPLICESIANRARNYVIENYSSLEFWERVLLKLNNCTS